MCVDTFTKTWEREARKKSGINVVYSKIKQGCSIFSV